MFGKNKAKKENTPAPETTFSSQDIIVHNMPSPARLSAGFSAAPKVSGDSANLVSAPPQQNFKTVGLVIIGGGIIVIGVLIYLSYRFIISPTAGKDKAATTVPVATEQKKATTTPTITPAVVPTTTPVIAAVAVPIEMSTSTATTSPLMNEELSGRDGSDLPPLLDSDQDGLIDEEEILLGTSATSTDSDADKYGDAAELAKGYDPAGAGKLATNPNLVGYENKTYGYSIIYPNSWDAKSLAGDATTVFVTPDDSLIQISIQDNQDKVGILSWYESSFPGTTATYDQLMNADGWDGIMGTDSLNFYLTDSKHDNIYVISYVPAVAGRIVYPNIFKLMINSLVIK